MSFFDMFRPHLLRPRMVELLVLALVAGAGGFVGAATRGGVSFAMGQLGQPVWARRVVVNIAGAALAGWVVGWLLLPEATDPLRPSDRPLRRREHLIVTGFLGGLTTVSGFAWDVGALLLIIEGQGGGAADAGERVASAYRSLAIILVANGCVGIAAAWAGLVWGRRFEGHLRALRRSLRR